MAAADVLLPQSGVNYDDQLILNEYQNILKTGKTSYGGKRYGATGALRRVGAGGLYGLPLITDAVYGGDLAYTGAEYGSADYDVSSWYGGVTDVDLATANYLPSSKAIGYRPYITDVQGLYRKPRTRILRHRLPNGGVTYQQNNGVQYLQPTPILEPLPLITREVRSQLLPPPLPLRFRRQVRPLLPPPPLVYYERPLAPPALVPSQTFVQRFNSLPVPPRPVIVESIPPVAPIPRPVILQKWLPYNEQAKRRTIIQRAPIVASYPRARNVVVQYEPTSARVHRNVQFLGVVQVDPQEYVQRYGATLLDSDTLERIARAAGVVENISPPTLASSVANNYQVTSSTGILDYDAAVVDVNGTGLEATFDGNALDVLPQETF